MSQDHSRVCGKNGANLLNGSKGPGSLPRVREKLIFWSRLPWALRITPACAGKTYPLLSNDRSKWDHSRVCGKNHSFYRQGFSVTGSLPRVREKHYYCFEFIFCHRITPACAGKTLECYHVSHQPWDHSRVCGKNKKFGQLYRTWLGSLPRVREKQ